MILRNCRSASSMPAAVQRSAISPDDQRLTLRCVRRTISIIDSHGFVDSSVRFSLPRTPSRVSVSVSSIPSRSEPAAPGVGVARARRRVDGAGRAHADGRLVPTPCAAAACTAGRSRSGRCSVTLRSLCRTQRCTGASPKTLRIALRSALAPSITNRIPCSGSRPRSTRSESSAVATVAFSVAAFPEPERDLDALGRDPERDHVGSPLQLEPVDHHHRQPHIVEAAAHQLAQRVDGCARRMCATPTTSTSTAPSPRPPSRPAPAYARTGASKRWPASAPSPPARSASRVSEVLVRQQPHLLARRRRSARAAARPRRAGRRASPRPPRGRAGRRPAPSSCLPFGPTTSSTSSSISSAQHAEPDADAQRQQPLLRRPNQLAERLLHPRRQHRLGRVAAIGTFLLHGGSSFDLWRIAANAPSRSGRGRRDRRQVLRATGQPRTCSPTPCGRGCATPRQSRRGSRRSGDTRRLCVYP